VTSTKTGTQLFCRTGLTVVGKPVAHGDDLVAGLDGALAQLGEVSALKASRLAEEPELVVRACSTPRNCGQPLLEGVVEAAGGQPAVEHGVDHVSKLAGANHLAGRRYGAGTRPECSAALRLAGVTLDEIEDLFSQWVGVHAIPALEVARQ
jgi:hypothetical protein